MKLTDTYTVPSHVRAQQLDDQTVILDLRNGVYFGLNQVGSRIWELIIEGEALGEIVTILSQEFEAPGPEIERDTVELARELKSRNLIASC